MSIIISKGGLNAKKLEPTIIQQEDYLQKYIHDNAECLPLHDLKDNFRLLILAREFATPRGGYIDLLGVDADGEVYIVETKLAKNADKRRVIAQALDYGAAIWGNPDDLLARAEDTAWRTRLLNHLGGDESAVTGCLANLEANVRAGRFWFVILMDHLDDGLRELIQFVNRNSNFKVLGVELEFYSHEDFEIVIPKLYGAESATEPGITASTASTRKVKWDETSFFANAKEELGVEVAGTMQELHDSSKTMGGVINGKERSFNVTFKAASKPVFYVYFDRGLEVNFYDLIKSDSVYAGKLREMLERSKFLTASDPPKSPRISIPLLKTRVHEFMQILQQSFD